MVFRETLPISEALAHHQAPVGIDAAAVFHRELRNMVEGLKAELVEQVLEPLRELARVLADQAADRDREPPAAEKPLMSLKEVVDASGWSESKIRREIAEGHFPKPVSPKGKKQFWKRFDVMRKLNQGG